MLLLRLLSFPACADSSQISTKTAARGQYGLDIQTSTATEPPTGPLRWQDPQPGQQLHTPQAGAQTATYPILPFRWQEAAGGRVPSLPAAASVAGP